MEILISERQIWQLDAKPFPFRGRDLDPSRTIPIMLSKEADNQGSVAQPSSRNEIEGFFVQCVQLFFYVAGVEGLEASCVFKPFSRPQSPQIANSG